MKNIFLIGGFLAIILNSLTGMIVSNYPFFNWILADISILSSTGIIFALYNRYLDNAFKAVFTFLFLASGFIRYILCLFASSHIENNWIILIVTFLFFFEILVFVLGLVLRKK